MNRPFLPSVTAALLALTALMGCGQETRRDPHTLVVGRSGDSRNLDPAFEATLTDGTIMELAYERLLRARQVDGIPTATFDGVLAERWESDPTGTRWTFHLRRDHRFDDGTAVTARAFAFSIERGLKVQPGGEANLFWLERYEVVDDYTLRFRLKFPFPAFLHFLAVSAVVINPAVMQHERDGDRAAGWLSEHTAGSGPYRVERWDRGQQLLMVRNPHHPGGARYFDRIAFRVIRDVTARRIELRKGTIDICEGLSAKDIADLGDARDVRIINRPSSALVFLDFNNQHPILRDARVRRALSLAIDREALVAAAGPQAAAHLPGPIPKGIAGFDPELPVIRRDLQAARRLLGETQWPHPKLTLSYTQGAAATDTAVLMLQSNLADAGVQLTLEPLAPSALFNKMMGGEYELLLNSFVAAFADPWLVMFPLNYSGNWGSGGNTARYRNERVDALLLEAQSTLDPQRRTHLYQQAQRLTLADAPRAHLFVPNGFLALRADLQGLDYSTWRPLVYNIAETIRTPPAH
jgi:peptide/nickel transport system substrate-binding protein